MRSRKLTRTPGFLLTFMIVIPVVAPPFLRPQDQNAGELRHQAAALEQKGQNSEAEGIWREIAQADARDAEAIAHLGLLEGRQGHYETAIDYYRRASAINSELPGLQMNLGLTYFKVGQFPDAIKCFAAELKRHPDDPRLTILLGMAHFGMKDYLVAIPYLQRGTERDPQNLALRATLAQSCLRSKQYQCVVRVQQQCVALNAESSQVDMLAAEALDQLGQGAEAIKQLRAAAILTPNEPNLHFGLGYLLWKQGKWKEAATEFDQELQTDPQNVRAQVYLTDTLVQQGEFAKALPILEKLSTLDGSYSLVHRDLGIIYVNTNRSEDAIREIRIATDSDPGDAELHLQAAKLYSSLGRTVEANTESESAKRLPAPHYPFLQELIDTIETPVP